MITQSEIKYHVHFWPIVWLHQSIDGLEFIVKLKSLSCFWLQCSFISSLIVNCFVKLFSFLAFFQFSSRCFVVLITDWIVILFVVTFVILFICLKVHFWHLFNFQVIIGFDFVYWLYWFICILAYLLLIRKRQLIIQLRSIASLSHLLLLSLYKLCVMLLCHIYLIIFKFSIY